MVEKDFPCYKLFKKGSTEAISYTGPKKADAMVSWLGQQTGGFFGLKVRWGRCV